MSLLNQHWNTPKDGITTGRAPAQIRLMNGMPLGSAQYAGVAHAYKLFTDAVRVTLCGFLTQDRVLPDGTRVRMVSNGGVDTVMVWPVGDGEESGRFFGGIAVQFEKVTFDADGENSGDLREQTIWVGNSQVIDAAKSLVLPSNAPGTAARCAKEGVLPEDLIIWVSPTAILSAESFKNGEVKIRRARVERGAVLDSNFGGSADDSKVTPRNLMSMDYADERVFYLSGRRLPFAPPPKVRDYAYPVFLLTFGFNAPFEWVKEDLNGLLVIGVSGGPGEIRIFATEAKKGVTGTWELLGVGDGVFESDIRYKLTTQKTQSSTTYTLRTPEALRVPSLIGETAQNDAPGNDVTIALAFPKPLANLSDINCTVTATKIELPPDPVSTISYYNYIKYDVTEGVLPDGREYKTCDLQVIRTTTSTAGNGGFGAATSHSVSTQITTVPVPYSFVNPLNGLTYWGLTLNATSAVTHTRTSGEFAITVESEGEYVAPVPVSGSYSATFAKDIVIADSYTGVAQLRSTLAYAISGAPGPAAAPEMGTGEFQNFFIDMGLTLPFVANPATISQNLVPTFAEPVASGGAGDVSWQVIQPYVDWGTDREEINGVIPFFVVQPVLSLMLPENISGEANIAAWRREVWDRHVSYTHTAASSDANNFVSGSEHFDIYGPERRADTPDTIRLEQDGFNLIGLEPTRNSVLSETSSFPSPEYRGPRTTEFIYDPRTRSYFLSAALDTESSGTGRRTQQSVMVIGNSQGHTDFYPILNAWIADEHAKAKDDVVEVYGDGAADQKIIVGLNLKPPTLV